MFKSLIRFSLIVIMLSCSNVKTEKQKPADVPDQENQLQEASSTDVQLKKASVNILTWPRMNLADFGCMLEKEFGYRDPKYNCSLTHYVNNGDPCKNTNEYYEGLTFPHDKRVNIYALIDTVMLDFEHGELREANLRFSSDLTIKELQHAFDIDPDNLPDNIMLVSYDENGEGKTNMLTLIGFEHIGSGDVDCGENE